MKAQTAKLQEAEQGNEGDEGWLMWNIDWEAMSGRMGLLLEEKAVKKRSGNRWAADPGGGHNRGWFDDRGRTRLISNSP